MKILGLVIGLILGLLNGLAIGFFTGNYHDGIVYCALISGGLSILLCKNEVINPEYLEYKSETSKLISSNAWVFWIASFLSALIVSVIFEVGVFHSSLISGLSGVWGAFVPVLFMVCCRIKDGNFPS